MMSNIKYLDLYYAAYGSNMNLEEMKKRCPDAKHEGTGTIEGYELLFCGEAGRAYLNVRPNSAKKVNVCLFKISENDVFIAIGFPRYSTVTIKAARFAKDKHATTIAITDMAISPLSEGADITLIARSDVISFVDSLVAPLSLINSLIIALAVKNKDDIPGTLRELEQIWREYEVYQFKNE